MPTEELRTLELPPEAVRLLTLATLLLGDASFVVRMPAAMPVKLQHRRGYTTCCDYFCRGISCAMSLQLHGVPSQQRDAAMLVVREARRGHIPGLTDLDCLNYLEVSPLVEWELHFLQIFVETLTTLQADDVVARDSERALGMLCAHHSAAAFAAYQAAVRQHALRTYRLEHSLPLFASWCSDGSRAYYPGTCEGLEGYFSMGGLCWCTDCHGGDPGGGNSAADGWHIGCFMFGLHREPIARSDSIRHRVSCDIAYTGSARCLTP